MAGSTRRRRLDVMRWDGPCLDCGTPARYLAANLASSEGAPVIGDGCVVEGTVVSVGALARDEGAPGRGARGRRASQRRVTVLVR